MANEWQLFRGKTSRQRRGFGFSLIEASAALAIMGAVVGSIWGVTTTANQSQQAALLARQALAVGAAAQAYIEQNQTALLANAGLATLNSAMCIKVTDSDTCATSMSSLKAQGYLPSDFPENTATGGQNSYGQTFRFYVRREDGGTASSADNGDKLVGLVLTTGGDEIKDKLGAQIADAMGAAGGFIYDADDGDAAGTTPGLSNATAVRGSVGGWSVDLTATGWSGIGSIGQQGHIAVLTSLLPKTVAGATSTSSSSCSGTQFAVVQKNIAGDNTVVANRSISFSSAVTTGNTVLVFVHGPDGAAAMGAGAVTDNMGNTYTRVVYNNYAAPNAYVNWIYVSIGVTGGSSFSVTVTPSSSQAIEVAVVEVAGITGTAADATGTVTRDSAATSTLSTSTATTQADEVAFVFAGDAGAYTNPVIQGNWTPLYDAASFSKYVLVGSIIAYSGLTSAGTKSYTIGQSGTFQRWAVIATFKVAAGCGPENSPITQRTIYQANVTSATPSAGFMSSVTAGNTIIALIAGQSSTSTFTMPAVGGVTDSQGNTYTRATQSPASTGGYDTDTRTYIYYATAASTGALTLTLHPSSSNNTISWQGLEVSGLDSSSQLDQTGTFQASMSSCSSATVTAGGATGQANELAFALINADEKTSTVGFGLESGWSSVQTYQSASSVYSYYDEISFSAAYRSYSSTATPSHTWTYTYLNSGCAGSEGVTASIATFKCSSTCVGAAAAAASSNQTLDGLSDAKTDYTNHSMFIGDPEQGTVTGTDNTFLGDYAGYSITSGSRNSLLGYGSISSVTTASDNTMIGDQTMMYASSAMTGITLFGRAAGDGVTSIADYTIGFGDSTFRYSTSVGARSIAFGAMSGKSGALTGTDNIALGYESMNNNNGALTGVGNIGVGWQSLYYVKGAGAGNIGIGSEGGYGVGAGSGNIFVGTGAGYYGAGVSINGNVAIGSCAMDSPQSTNYAVFIGYSCANQTNVGDKSYSVAIGGSSQDYNLGGTMNTSVGSYTLFNVQNGDRNTAIGEYAAGSYYGTYHDVALLGSENAFNNSATGTTSIGWNAMDGQAGGARNTAIGGEALFTNASGTDNTAVGVASLRYKSAAVSNMTAVGTVALNKSTTATFATAIGYYALNSSFATAAMTGANNTAVGNTVLTVCRGACASNTGVGTDTMSLLTTGTQNTGLGLTALSKITTNSNGAALGYQALKNATGATNSGMGANAGMSVAAGANNLMVGYNAGVTGTAVTTGSNSTFIGSTAGGTAAAAANRLAIGYGASSNADAKYIFGNASVTSIGGYANWSNLSDRRIKRDIRPIELGSDFIRQLRPVRFVMKQGNGRLDYGFIAQELLEVLGNRQTNVVSGTGDEATGDYYMMVSTMLIAPAVKAMQEGQGDLESAGHRLQNLNLRLTKMDGAAASLTQTLDLAKAALTAGGQP